MTKPQDNESADIREQTRRSIARLISIQRGDETCNDDDYVTAGNILIVCSRIIDQETRLARIDELKRAKMQGYIAGPLTHRVDRRINALTDTKHT